ncbi:uncharacterized protein METZ01_LOCUS436184, partial [marine metagenome]
VKQHLKQPYCKPNSWSSGFIIVRRANYNPAVYTSPNGPNQVPIAQSLPCNYPESLRRDCRRRVLGMRYVLFHRFSKAKSCRISKFSYLILCGFSYTIIIAIAMIAPIKS